ncbi:MAG: adenylyl-sulfate kinase [Pseudomonadota bacterium]|nr:adenylyl-sulfate kinase [Pseudomonadota bacterium]
MGSKEENGPKSNQNLVEVQSSVSDEEKALRNGHKGGVLWFTGLPGSGKSTLAVELERCLFDSGYNAFVLDGDNVRSGLNADLGFSPEDRTENIRRVGEVAALMANAGLITIAAFISPYKSDRRQARTASGMCFHEIAIVADLSTCEARDPKGHYKKARLGEIPDFTGVSAPYEYPETPDLVVDTDSNTITRCVDLLVEYVQENFILKDG